LLTDNTDCTAEGTSTTLISVLATLDAGSNAANFVLIFSSLRKLFQPMVLSDQILHLQQLPDKHCPERNIYCKYSEHLPVEFY
jgi:hypothetical protein